MKSILIVAAIIGLIYFVFLHKPRAPDETPQVMYQQQVEKAEQLPQQLQETVDQRLEEVDEEVDTARD